MRSFRCAPPRRLPGSGAGRIVALAVVLALTAAACGGGGVAPREWASRVCQALGPWTEEIGSLTDDTQAQMTQAQTPKQAKEAIVALLGGAEQASEDARKGVEIAGIPDVENGEKIAKQFADALTGARDSYRKARTAVEKLSVKDADDFYDGVVTVMDRLNTDYSQTGVDTEKLSSEELQEAFDESPDCR